MKYKHFKHCLAYSLILILIVTTQSSLFSSGNFKELGQCTLKFHLVDNTPFTRSLADAILHRNIKAQAGYLVQTIQNRSLIIWNVPNREYSVAETLARDFKVFETCAITILI